MGRRKLVAYPQNFQTYLFNDLLLASVGFYRRELDHVGSQLIRDLIAYLACFNFTKFGWDDILPIGTLLLKRHTDDEGT